ncbi:MAG: metallophosphoesterase family protein [Promethearchaeota archaeon]
MVVDIGIVGDTHLQRPNQANLSSVLRKVFKGVDFIIHTGDFTSEEVLSDLELIAPVVACHGNMDPPSLKRKLPKFATEQFGDILVGVTHAMPGREDIVESGVKILVTGHTHVPKIEELEIDVLLLNPGSPTRPRAPPKNKFIPWLPRPAVPTVILLRISGTLSHAYIIRLARTN